MRYATKLYCFNHILIVRKVIFVWYNSTKSHETLLVNVCYGIGHQYIKNIISMVYCLRNKAASFAARLSQGVLFVLLLNKRDLYRGIPWETVTPAAAKNWRLNSCSTIHKYTEKYTTHTLRTDTTDLRNMWTVSPHPYATEPGKKWPQLLFSRVGEHGNNFFHHDFYARDVKKLDEILFNHVSEPFE